MIPLDSVAAEHVRSWLGEPRGPGLLDLHHALAHHRRGLWGDDARVPRSVLHIRQGEGQLEAFGAGEPEPALGWLLGRARQPLALLAPEDWWDAAGRRAGAAERAEALTLSVDAGGFLPDASAVAVRRLTAGDTEAALEAAMPAWALAGWTSCRDLVEHGAGFAVPFGRGYAALAWVSGRAAHYEAIGVLTVARFRRLGLGRAVASALVAEVLHRRGRVPLWTTTPGNAASLSLARSLGFSDAAAETYLRWPRPVASSTP